MHIFIDMTNRHKIIQSMEYCNVVITYDVIKNIDPSESVEQYIFDLYNQSWLGPTYVLML